MTEDEEIESWYEEWCWQQEEIECRIVDVKAAWREAKRRAQEDTTDLI